MRGEIKRAFTSPLFFLSMGVFFLTLQGYAVPSFLSFLAEPIEYRESALALSLGGIFFGGAILLQPFCSPMAHSVSQVDDLRSGMMQLSLLRSSVGSYVFRKVVSSFLASAVAMGGAFAIHALVWNIIGLPYQPNIYPEHQLPFAEESFFYNWANIAYALPIYVEISLTLAFTAGIWSVVALATAIWVPDKLLVVIIPAGIYYLWSGNLSYYLFGFRLISPGTLFNDWQTPARVQQAIIAYAIVLIISLFIYYVGVKRRACYA